MRNHFGHKVFKVALDGGFDCPNRDGTAAFGGCTFCSAAGSGDFAGNRKEDLVTQFHEIKDKMHEKWKDGKLSETELQRFAMRWYGVKEFKLVLERLGFTDIVISADYTYGAAPEHDRQTITFEAVKPE